MARKRSFARPFTGIVDGVAERNAATLMARARLANRIAKTSEGRGRRLAYGVKTGALQALHARFPDRVELAVDPVIPKFVLVRVPELRFGLHAPADRFERGVACAA